VEDTVYGRRYRATERIGSGGMAEVYKAVDEVLGRTVAIKVLHERYAAEPNFVARFRQEAQAAANLSHPNIVNIYDWGQDGNTYYIVMEYVAGTDLKSLVQQNGPMDPLKVAEYGAQVCSALAVAHGYDVIHRDIKPHNIVLTPEGTIKVMDFGIARAGNTTMTQTGSVLGTAQYISPEQAQGRTLGPASDLYSLGITLYEMVTGKLPFDADTPVAVALKQVNEQPRPPRELRPSIPVELETIIMRSLRKNPAERYASAKEMRAELRRVASGQPLENASGYDDRSHYNDRRPMSETSVMPAVAAATTGRQSNVRQVQKKRTSPWVWIAVAVLVLLAGAGVVWGLGVFGTGKISTPSVVGLTEDAAKTALEAQGLTLGAVTTQNSADVKSGEVISQDPRSGTKIDSKTAVNVVISSGVESVAVPDLQGMTETDAIDELRNVGLEYDRTADEYSSDVQEGFVIRSDPAAKANVAKGSAVVLYVSKGTEKVQVPDVTGKTFSTAKQELTAAGLKVSSKDAYSDSVNKGNVISQSPQSSVYVDAGTTVTLTISKGNDTVEVPDTTGMNEVDARAALDKVGLKVKVDYLASPDNDVVLTQSPLPTTIVKRSATVTLTVGQTPTQ